MTIKTKAFLGAIAMVSIAVFASVLFTMVNAAEFPQQAARVRAHASSTTYALSAGTAQRIVATSTREAATATLPITAGRTGVTVQPINCGAGAIVTLGFNDVAPTATTGLFVNASTTLTLGDDVPPVHGSVRAISTTGNCSLLVTEWRSEI